MKNIAIIPARSGSKGLIDKNIKLLNGLPLIAYSIIAAQKANLFDEIFVSTDSLEYADIARKFGANTRFLRDEKLSNSTASSWNVIRDVLTKFEGIGKKFDTVALLQPTSPLRTEQDIINSYELLNSENASSIIGICEAEHSPLWMNTLPIDFSMDKFITEELAKPRQQLETYYRINGAIYITKTAVIMKGDNIYQNSFAYIMPKERSIDIDTKYDFDVAEYLMNLDIEKFDE